MKFRIRLGEPEVKELWEDLGNRRCNDKLSKAEIIFHDKLGKTFNLISTNPKHPSLSSHEIEPLTKRYGRKVWESYLENKVPAAGRIFWVYGPAKNEITIIGIEPHPEDKKRGGFDRIKLSALNETKSLSY